jgi:hypothetical protein
VITALLVASLLAQAPAPAAPAPPQPAAPVADPATVTFATSTGLLLVAIKPDKVADYEGALAALQGALAADVDQTRRAMAQGWRVFKAAETDAKGNVLYVHALLPAVPGADYRPSILLDMLLKDAPVELLAKYKDAFAAPPSKLSLTELGTMGVAPVKK